MLNMLNNSNAVTMSGPPHFVDLHLNPGESVSIQLFDGNETVLRGPATITMISQHTFPPIPMPVQVPPGHMVQQIVDENGTLRHIILSSLNNNGTTAPAATIIPQQQAFPFCCCYCYCNSSPNTLATPTPPLQPLPPPVHHNNLLTFPAPQSIRRRIPHNRNYSYSKRSSTSTSATPFNGVSNKSQLIKNKALPLNVNSDSKIIFPNNLEEEVVEVEVEVEGETKCELTSSEEQFEKPSHSKIECLSLSELSSSHSKSSRFEFNENHSQECEENRQTIRINSQLNERDRLITNNIYPSSASSSSPVNDLLDVNFETLQNLENQNSIKFNSKSASKPLRLDPTFSNQISNYFEMGNENVQISESEVVQENFQSQSKEIHLNQPLNKEICESDNQILNQSNQEKNNQTNDQQSKQEKIRKENLDLFEISKNLKQASIYFVNENDNLDKNLNQLSPQKVIERDDGEEVEVEDEEVEELEDEEDDEEGDGDEIVNINRDDNDEERKEKDKIEIESNKLIKVNSISEVNIKSEIESFDVINAANSEVESNKVSYKSSPQRFPKHSLPQLQIWNLTYTSLTATSVKLKWTYSQGNFSDSFSPSKHFMVEMMHTKTNSRNETLTTSRIVYQGIQNTCRVSHLNSQQQYSFKVRTISEDHLLVSNVLRITTPEQSLKSHKKTKGQLLQQQIQQHSSYHHHSHSHSHQHQHQQVIISKHQENQMIEDQDSQEKSLENNDQKCAIIIISMLTVLAVVFAFLINFTFLND